MAKSKESGIEVCPKFGLYKIGYAVINITYTGLQPLWFVFPIYEDIVDGNSCSDNGNINSHKGRRDIHRENDQEETDNQEHDGENNAHL